MSSVDRCGGNAMWTRGRQPLVMIIAVLLMLCCIFYLYLDVPNHRLLWSSVNTKLANNRITVDSDTNLYSVAYPHDYRFLLDEPKRCLYQDTYLVIMIPVAPHDWKGRDAIRKTWGGETNVQGKRVSYFFLLGQAKDQNKSLQDQLLNESLEHRDLLQGDFVDSYHNLTIKTMLMLEWLTSRCPSASYGMKTDSDVFLNVHSLVEMLKGTPARLYMTGKVVRRASVLRDPNSKWFMPEEEFPEHEYPPYALGLSYVFSMDLPRKIHDASRHVKAIWLEDVYLGLCMRYLGIDLTDPPSNFLFLSFMPVLWPNWNSTVVALLESPQQLLDVWRHYKMDNI